MVCAIFDRVDNGVHLPCTLHGPASFMAGVIHSSAKTCQKSLHWKIEEKNHFFHFALCWSWAAKLSFQKMVTYLELTCGEIIYTLECNARRRHRRLSSGIADFTGRDPDSLKGTSTAAAKNRHMLRVSRFWVCWRVGVTTRIQVEEALVMQL